MVIYERSTQTTTITWPAREVELVDEPGGVSLPDKIRKNVCYEGLRGILHPFSRAFGYSRGLLLCYRTGLRPQRWRLQLASRWPKHKQRHQAGWRGEIRQRGVDAGARTMEIQSGRATQASEGEE